jgi:hypothetical protein
MATDNQSDRTEERKMESCYIIMPITTPESLLPQYGNDRAHFKHVLDLLFVPAVQKAGMVPIRPSVEGSELIHGAIIENLEKASCVLCDMSALNANVFFELGIRTSLNLPVCLVRDDSTPKSPFDTSIISHVPYDSALHAWDLADQIQKLAKHLEDSLRSCAGVNPLWKYFGMTVAAHPPESGSTDDKLALIVAQLEQLRASERPRNNASSGLAIPDTIVEDIVDSAITFRESLKASKIPLTDANYEMDRVLTRAARFLARFRDPTLRSYLAEKVPQLWSDDPERPIVPW